MRKDASYSALCTQKKEVGTTRAAGAAPTSDEQWLSELKADSTYPGIDVEREHSKMIRWCQANRKQPTRRRFTNWLNNCDRPLGPATTPNNPAKFETASFDPKKL